MAGANFGFVGIVTEKLTEENYINWKECLKSYFIANGLWDVVTGEEDKPEEGSKDIRSKYKGNESAKKEWDILAKKVRQPRLDGEDKQETLSLLEYRTLYKAVAKGDWE
ncbi:hypothetical protein Pint_27202 [Pistacia integerrima]|uniref:Uncharacterized protein n=1 Tax=Pistacia integerrima TaxID=434235 RepID=A0ACC0YQE3_9ROSI|nr:hypothetical protein Pint_27202 [Pistacia integerrima]